MKLSQTTVNRAIHILLYGGPKVGKSELAGELANHGFKLHWFDLENGSITLVRSIPEEYQESVNLFKIPDTKDFPIAIETILKVIKPGKHRLCDQHGKVECPLCKPKALTDETITFSEFDNQSLGPKDIVVFDSLTQLSNSAMNHIGKGKDDTWKPEWENYRAQGQMLERFLSSIQNAPYHVIVITHEAGLEVREGDKEEKIIPVGGTRNFARTVAKYFDEVVYMEVKNKIHRAASSTTYSLNVLTGSRSRTAVEEQVDTSKKPEDRPHISLLPIFINQGIAQGKAENILEKVKANLIAAKG
jgi:DNA replicative helicase MCM subunit Mcm2 (Cdc46/Mcm family)